MGHRLFFRRISQNKEYVENFCKDLNNLFTLHVVNGNHIIIHNVDTKKYIYMYSNTKKKYSYSYTRTNKFNFSKILPLNSIFQIISNDKHYVIIIKKVFITIYHV